MTLKFITGNKNKFEEVKNMLSLPILLAIAIAKSRDYLSKT